MISIRKDLIGSPHKTIITGNLVDFKKNRENINVCVRNLLLKPHLVCFFN
jgi:hypothetical protein